jgi:hypothetical protein
MKQFIYSKNLNFLPMFKQKLAFLILIFSFLIFVPHASASTLYLSPGSANIPQGSVVSVSIGLNTGGDSVNGVSAYLAYPADKLEVAWISYGGAFSIAAEGTYGGGGIKISRGSISGVTGSVNVATVGFRGKALGSATVAFIGGSGAPRASDSSDSLNLGGSSGGTFTVVAPLSGGQAGKTATPSPAKDQKVPGISNINVSLISTTAATISWVTDEEASSVVEYGLQSNKYFLAAGDQALTTSHVVKIEGPVLSPGTIFHYRIRSKDTAGNEGVSADKTFKLKGYNVTLKILDKENKPLSKVQVLLYPEPDKSQTSPTGDVSFTDITAGKHVVVVKVNGFDRVSEIIVQDAPLSQVFELNIDAKLTGLNYLYLGLIAVGLIGLAALIVVFFLKRKQKLTDNNPGQQIQPQPVQEPPVQEPQVQQQPIPGRTL